VVVGNLDMLIDAYVGRQPIFDRNRRLFGYELLYRASPANEAGTFEASMATSSVMVGALIDFDIQRILGPHLGFVNMSREFLLGDLALAVPPERLVVEVLEDVELDGEVLAALTKLSSLGYLIALDDYVCAAHQEALLPLADIVKIDIAVTGIDAIPGIQRDLAPWGVDLLAEKVETHEEFRRLHELGFQYFQGYFLARPEVVPGTRINSEVTAATQLVARMGEPGASFDELAELIARDVGLSYKLLKVLNSSFYGLTTVSSTRQGLVMLGVDQISRWILLIAMSSAGDKPAELTKMGLLRGRMAENLAAHVPGVDGRSAFTVGMFSVLDAILGQPMEEVVTAVALNEEVSRALLHREGPLGRLLATVEHHERGDWSSVDAQGHERLAVLEASLEAIEWTDRAASQLVTEDA
jgi:EAL and modified HD-GYP domain-containing signal transduction protein